MNNVEPIRSRTQIENVKRILKKSSARNYLLFLIGINCGLRISDLLKLRVRDVMDMNSIMVREQKTGKYKKIPITNSFKPALKSYIRSKRPEDWLFRAQSNKNRPITRVQAYRIISEACKKAGITAKIGTHTLRKTFGYHFYNQHKDIALLQSILNHSAPSITLLYIGINQDMIDLSLNSFCL